MSYRYVKALENMTMGMKEGANVFIHKGEIFKCKFIHYRTMIVYAPDGREGHWSSSQKEVEKGGHGLWEFCRPVGDRGVL